MRHIKALERVSFKFMKRGDVQMKNKDLIEKLMSMDLEKEVKVKSDCMSVEIRQNDVEELENIITIRSL